MGKLPGLCDQEGLVQERLKEGFEKIVWILRSGKTRAEAKLGKKKAGSLITD